MIMIRFHQVFRSLVLLLAVLSGNVAVAGDFFYFNERGGAGGTPREIYKFDPLTGISTLQSTVAVAKRFYSLDRQPSTGIVFAVEPLTSGLYTLDTNTGAATLVGTIPVNTIISIAFDPTTGILYGNSLAFPDGLYTIDPVTAAATLIGPMGQQRRALCFDNSGQLYGFLISGRLVQVDKNTGANTVIGPTGGSLTVVSDATFTADGKLYASDYSGSLHEVDPLSGVVTPIGTTGLGQGLLGICGEISCSGSPTTYCTGKLNALGCTPSIGSSGAPSATAGSGFVINCTQVRNNKSGLLFYGVNGPAAVPFQQGTLCVKTPIKRTAGQSSGGTPAPANDCSGTWSIDMNAFAVSAGPPAPLPALVVPGTTVNCQWWGRDPGFAAPNNTQLSNGLSFSICP
jgi:hypothetical protein